MNSTVKMRFDDSGKPIGKISTTALADGTRVEVQALPIQAIPIIFIPGILGSPLMALGENAKVMGKDNKWSWYPDYIGTWMAGFPWIGTQSFAGLPAKERKELLDPTQTRAFTPYEKDVGKSIIRRIKRSLRSHFLYFFPTSEPLFSVQEALRRGWGTVGWNTAYNEVLPYLENILRYLTYATNSNDTIKIDEVKKALKEIEKFPDAELNTAQLFEYLDTSAHCHYPVFAVGYNWLESNAVSADLVYKHIEEILQYVQADSRTTKDSNKLAPPTKDKQGLGWRCDKGIILVTHSMGGLVARKISQKYSDKLKIRGIVHDVQPCNGSATLYYRMRAGWEGIGGKFIANTGPLLAPILGGAAGGLELAPNQFYGANWLQLRDAASKNIIFSTPSLLAGNACDPYREIYLRKDVWWRLVEPQLIAPEAKEADNPDAILEEEWDKYGQEVLKTKIFHQELGGHYHPNTYLNYGGSAKVKSWANIFWDIKGSPNRQFQHSSGIPAVCYTQTSPVTKDEIMGAKILKGIQNPDKYRGGKTWLQASNGKYLDADLQDGADSGDGVVPYNSANPWLSRSGPKSPPSNMNADTRTPNYSSKDWVTALGPEPDPIQFIFEFRDKDFPHSDAYKVQNVLDVTFFSILNVIASDTHPINQSKPTDDTQTVKTAAETESGDE